MNDPNTSPTRDPFDRDEDGRHVHLLDGMP